MTAIYNSATCLYEGICTTCGQPTGSADLWQATCPRCAELADLEREIGRAYCYQAQAINARIYQSASDRLACNILTDAAVYAEKHADALLTRYRALLRKEAK